MKTGKEDYDKIIEEAKRELEGNERPLFDLYVVIIRRAYDSGDLTVREVIGRKLESLDSQIGKLNRQVFTQTLAQKKILFDYEIAREIRIKAGLSQTDLAKLLEPTIEVKEDTWRRSKLSEYERGKAVPSNTGDFSPKYLRWLKRQGYNPYNLPDEDAK